MKEVLVFIPNEIVFFEAAELIPIAVTGQKSGAIDLLNAGCREKTAWGEGALGNAVKCSYGRSEDHFCCFSQTRGAARI